VKPNHALTSSSGRHRRHEWLLVLALPAWIASRTGVTDTNGRLYHAQRLRGNENTAASEATPRPGLLPAREAQAWTAPNT
jgi:hypothetical protein